MRHQALDYVCATCRSQAKSQSVLSRTSRRYIQISATPSSSEPLQQSLDASNGSSTPGAGTHPPIVHSLSRTTDEVSRRPIRSPRQPLLPPLRLHLRFAKPVRPQRHPRRLQRQPRECRLHPLASCAFPKSSTWYTIPIPAHLLDYALYSAHSDQITYHELGGSTLGWEVGLDGCATEGITGLDGCYAQSKSETEYEDGEHHMTSFLPLT